MFRRSHTPDPLAEVAATWELVDRLPRTVDLDAPYPTGPSPAALREASAALDRGFRAVAAHYGMHGWATEPTADVLEVLDAFAYVASPAVPAARRVLELLADGGEGRLDPFVATTALELTDRLLDYLEERARLVPGTLRAQSPVTVGRSAERLAS